MMCAYYCIWYAVHTKEPTSPRRLYHSPILLRADNTATILAVAVSSFGWCYAPNWFERYKYAIWTRTNLILIRVSSVAFSNLSLLLSLLPTSALRSIKLWSLSFLWLWFGSIRLAVTLLTSVTNPRVMGKFLSKRQEATIAMTRFHLSLLHDLCKSLQCNWKVWVIRRYLFLLQRCLIFFIVLCDYRI